MNEKIEISRRKSRVNAIKMLYMAEINGISILDARVMLIEENDDESDIIIHDEQAVKFAFDVFDDINKIDDIISSSLTNYSISRLNYVDLAIIRLCTKELLDGTEPAICINEAIDISKKFTDLDDKLASKFNNRLLQTIKEKILGE